MKRKSQSKRRPSRKRPATSRPKKPTRRWRVPDCKRFTGYKPCFPGTTCATGCIDPAPRGTRILIVNLDAMGNVLVTTSILSSLKRRYPVSTISWITLKNAAPLLQHNPYVDAVYLWEPESWLILQRQVFDLVLNVDKSRRSGAFLGLLQAREVLGFGIDGDGVIVPLNPEAEENYLLGLDDHLKFRMNTKTVSQLLCEQFRLPYRRDEYVLELSQEEQEYCRAQRTGLGLDGARVVVGLNTGCSELYPNKKLSVEQHVDLVRKLSALPGIRTVLLGGPEDTERNAEIARRIGMAAVPTPTAEGLRKGLCSINLCDVVVSGDSFGMHAAIALRKHVIVWFGVSCPAEIELFGRGLKLIPEGLFCSPCWKQQCPYNLECRSMVDLDRIVGEVRRYAEKQGN